MKKTLLSFFLIILSFQQVKAQLKPDVITNDSTQKNTLPFYEAVTNFSNLLDGSLPGVQVSNSVQPGASGTILLRGIHSLDNKDAPLIVIDGAPYFADINTININDIQSIKLLKGPEASGIYGFRGVNGVIEIRTRKARDKKMHLTVDAAIGINNRAFPGYDVLTSEKDFYETAWDAAHNTFMEGGMNSADAAQRASQNLISMLGGYNSYNVPDSEVINPLTGKLNPAAQLKYHDDWRKALQRTALRHDYNVSASKSGKKGNLFFSAGYLNDGGYIKHTGYERLTARLNGNFNFTSWLKAGLNISGATSTTDVNDPSALSNPFYAMQSFTPIFPVYDYDAEGNRNYDPITGTDKLNWRNAYNALGSLLLDKNRYKQSNIRAIPYIQLHFLKHFSLSSHFFYNYYKEAFEGTYNPYYGIGAGVGGIRNTMDLKNRNYIWTQELSWSRELGQHHLALSIGHENDKRNIKQSANEYIGTIPQGHSYTLSEFKFKSLFGQFHYGFKDKYLFHAALRRDVNEQAFLSMREQMSWSAGASWKINQENLLRQSRNINLLKINVDYGKSNRSGKLISRKLDIGMEFAFFQNRLSGYLDYFNRRDDNLLIAFPSAPSTGIPGVILPFDLGTQGLELNLKGMLVQRKDFYWSASLNLGHYTNRILTMPNGYDSIILGNLLAQGVSPQNYYLVESAGVDPQTGNALYYYRDANGEKKTTTDYSMAAVKGEELAGTMTPDVFGGFSNTLAYNHFEFSFRLTFALGGKYYDYNYQQLMEPSLGQNWSTDILNHWTPENRNTNVPKPDVSNAWEGANTRFLSSASWLNVNNVSLAYHFNNRELSHLHLNNLSLYISATNLWMFSARKGMNPQASLYDNAIDLYAPARTILFGLHAGL